MTCTACGMGFDATRGATDEPPRIRYDADSEPPRGSSAWLIGTFVVCAIGVGAVVVKQVTSSDGKGAAPVAPGSATPAEAEDGSGEEPAEETLEPSPGKPMVPRPIEFKVPEQDPACAELMSALAACPKAREDVQAYRARNNRGRGNRDSRVVGPSCAQELADLEDVLRKHDCALSSR